MSRKFRLHIFPYNHNFLFVIIKVVLEVHLAPSAVVSVLLAANAAAGTKGSNTMSWQQKSEASLSSLLEQSLFLSRLSGFVSVLALSCFQLAIPSFTRAIKCSKTSLMMRMLGIAPEQWNLVLKNFLL